MSLIYLITNTANERKYVGRTGLSLRVRWSGHKAELKRQLHRNEHLQADWNLYGESVFSYKELETVERSEVDVKEKYWISKIQPYYNLEKINRKTLLPATLSPEQVAQFKTMAKSLGYIYAGEGSIHNLVMAILSGDVILSKK